MDVQPATAVSRAYPSSFQANSGKRDISREGQSNEKCQKFTTDWNQADEYSDLSGTAAHQAEFQPNSNEQQLFKSPKTYAFRSTDVLNSGKKKYQF